MTTILCTLYNSLYLDKGLVLYDSLCKCAKDFKLYVLCMDEKTYEVLAELKQEHHIPVRLSDFEAEDTALRIAKGNRSVGEYCWTCSSSFIKYVLCHHGENNCTYIDADMSFYNDPQILVDEMLDAKKSVMVVPHWFHQGNRQMSEKVGEYCVEFNTFLNNKESLEVLDYWRKRCLEMCKNIGDGIHWGDQKYLEELVEKYSCVHVCKNRGAGLAPWNISSYRMDKQGMIESKETRERFRPIFVHFQGISNVGQRSFSIDVKRGNGADSNLIEYFYKRYLAQILYWKKELSERYGLKSVIMGHPTEKVKWDSIKRSKMGGCLYRAFLRLLKREFVVTV